jgi:FkbM family methyltransferase
MVEKIFEKKLNSNYNKIISITSNMKICSIILSPFIHERIIQHNIEKSIIEETVKIPRLKKIFIQQTEFKKNTNNKIEINTKTGIFKNSVVTIDFKNNDEKCVVSIGLNIHLPLKYKLLKFIIEKKILRLYNLVLEELDCLTQLIEGDSWNTCFTKDNGLIINKNSKKLTILGWAGADIQGIFCKEDYAFLPIENKVVFDIGANVCDSSLYFITKNPEKIIAVEPFIQNIQIAKKNILANNLNGKIILELAALSVEDGSTKIDENYQHLRNDNNFNNLNVIGLFKEGTTISTYSMKTLLSKYDVNEAVLKLDCEGCEYDTIFNSDKETLRKFSHIIMEYHNGYLKLEEQLKKYGFHVKTKFVKREDKRGFLYATRE